MRGKIGDAGGALVARIILLQHQRGVLLAIEIGSVAADAALQPVILRIIARQPADVLAVADAAGDHRLLIIGQRGVRLPLHAFQPRRIAKHQRFVLRRRLRRGALLQARELRGGLRDVADCLPRQRHAAIAVQARLRGRQRLQRRARLAVALQRHQRFDTPERRVAVVGIPLKHLLISLKRLLRVAARQRPVSQRQVAAAGGGLLTQQRDGVALLPCRA